MTDSRRRPIGLAHFSAIGVEPAEFVTRAAAAGFGAVGFRLFPAFPGAPYYTLRAGGPAAREVRLRLDDTGLALHDIEFVVIGADFDPASVRPVLGDAAELGARRLSVCGDDPDPSRFADRFAALCAVAAEVGMAVDLENMGWRAVRGFADSIAAVEAAGAPNGGVLVDALHFFRNGGALADLAAAEPALIRHAQLCDVRGPAPGDDEARIAEARAGRFAPGEGDLPLADLLAAVPEEAAVSVEVPIDAATSVERHLARLFEGASRVMSGTTA
ncbi:sugar phosphate isomerase/epimerase family protein [Amaricoccus sp. W119]|uniref:sugar phosphate isomerase/epimerase family protein n=1 Tax=Amaricoccus sp. W119 TaxID=3391833 RepID=UPI0039A541B7